MAKSKTDKDTKIFKFSLKNEKTKEVTEKEVTLNYKNGHVFIVQDSALLDEDFQSSGSNKKK